MSITPPNVPPDPPTWGLLTQSIASIADSLAVIADYVQELRADRSGERTYEIGAWVLSATSEGDPCVFLYSTHPKLDYRVTTVYIERFADLPFDAMAPGARTYDGEQAPTRSGAAQRGYLVHCAPFTVATRLTGAKTAAGHEVHRFARIVSAPQPASNPLPAPGAPEPAPDQTEPPSNTPTRGAAGPRRVSADAAILALLHARERHYLDTGFTGPTQTVTYSLWQRLVNNLLGPEGRDYVTARLANATLKQVEHDKWLPSRARMAAMLEWLMEHDADKTPIRPYRIRPDGEGELRIVLAEAMAEFGEPA